jgi:lipoate-protein ligase A
MAENWRIVDTGLRPAAQNVALDRALLEARRAEEIPSTLRFHRFTSCALIGCGRSPGQELHLEACQKEGVEVQRRLTGGDVMVLDPGQLAWALYLHRRDIGSTEPRAIARRLCHAAATAVSTLGVDARYRPYYDIEVDGRSIASSAVVFDGDALLFQATLNIDLDPARLARASRLAAAAPGAMRDRIASLGQLLGTKPETMRIRGYLREAFESEFGVEFGESDLTLSEQGRFRTALTEVDHADWINLISRPAADLPLLRARRPVNGGGLEATVAYDLGAKRIRQAWFASDLSVSPRRVLSDLEFSLRDVPVDRLTPRVERFFAGLPAATLPFGSSDIVELLQLTIGQPLPAGMDEKNTL